MHLIFNTKLLIKYRKIWYNSGRVCECNILYKFGVLEFTGN